MNLANRASYLKGLADGLKIDEIKTDEAKLLSAMVTLIGEMSDTVDEITASHKEMVELLDLVDHDLGNLEQEVYGLDDDCDCCDDDCDCCDDDFEYEVTCPTCNETLCLSEDEVSTGEIICPNCHEALEFDIDDDECACEHCHAEEK